MKYKCISLIVFFVMLSTAGFSQQNNDSARDTKKSPTKHERHYEGTESQMGVQFHPSTPQKPRDPLIEAYHEARRQGDAKKMRELELQFKRPAANVGDSKGPLTRRKSTTAGFPGEPNAEGPSGHTPDWGDDIHVRGVNTDFRESYPAMATASNGDMYIAWENVGQSGYNDYIQLYKSTDGGLTWTPFGFLLNSSFNLNQPSLAIGEGNQDLLVIAYVVNDVVPFIEVATSPLSSSSFTMITPAYYAFWTGYSKPNVWTDSYDYSFWYIYLTAEAHVSGTTNYNVVFWRSTDYGATYTNPAGVPLGNSDPYTWQDPDGTYGTTGNDIYIAAFNATDNYLYVIRSQNFGSTWSDTFQVRQVSPLPINPVDPDIEATVNYDNLMIVCTKGSSSDGDNIGQVYSTNSGLSWTTLLTLEGYQSYSEFAPELTANEGGGNWHLTYTGSSQVHYNTRPQDLSALWQSTPDIVNDNLFGSNSYPKKAITSNWTTDVPGIAWADYRDGSPDYDIYFDRNPQLKLYQGPAIGNIPGGAMENTGNFAKNESRVVLPQKALEKMIRLREIPLAPAPPDMIKPLAPLGSNEFEDVGMPSDQPLLIDDFAGIPNVPNSAGFSFFPPDPICAVGPNHIMAAANTDFAIFDKSGVKLKEIDATEWFENVLPGLDPGLTEPFGIAYDPQIVYDHFANHWVMIYAADNNINQSYLLLSVSDDSDPIGDWYNYAIPGNTNGMGFNTFQNDYPKLGIDAYNFYITANMFDLAGAGFQYVQLRTIEKYQIYNNPAGPLEYVDFWDLRDPDNLAQKLNTDATVAPAVTYGYPAVEYLINASPYSSGTFMTLWQVPHPYAPDTLTAVNVPVTAYEYPPDAGQPGTPPLEPIDTGGWRVRNAVYRDGFLWTAHTVADAGGLYARARSLKLDVTGPSVSHDISYGSPNFWYYYPAVTADIQGNTLMVFNSSATSQFAGVRFAGIEGGTAYGSVQIKAGEVNHEQLDGSGRNRWGDYNGIAVDPENPNVIWMFAEYATTNLTTWGTWWGEVSFNPHPQPQNLVAMDGYHGSVPLYWESPTGFGPLKAIAGSALNSSGSKNSAFLSTENAKENANSNSLKSNGIDAVLLSYNIRRSTNPGGPYTLIANVNRQYYRDVTANNGTTYYYVVEAVYDDGVSIPSNEADGSPVIDGYVINSGYTYTPPTLDGLINVGEWSDAAVTDITAIGSPNPVTLYTMNDANYLYLAVDDANNTNPEDDDEFGIYFDEDYNFEWPVSSPGGEGNFWIDYRTTPPHNNRYRGISGWWPANLVFEASTMATGVNQGIDFSSGHIQFEVQIDLSASELNASTGDAIGCYTFSLDNGSFLYYGNWPVDVDPHSGGTWSGPFSYGTLILATDPNPIRPPESLVALEGYDGAVPLYWDPPIGIAPLKPAAGSAANSSGDKAPSLQSTEKTAEKEKLNISKIRGIESNLLSYNISRGTNPGGPYSPIANVNRQYYRDLTANNGTTYYYVVEAVYDDGVSIPSNEADGSPVMDGYVINSGYTYTAPTLDGLINAGEWSEAAVTDITAIGSPNPVTLYTMNDANYLYLAVDDANNTNPEDDDELGIYFDEDYNFEWPVSSPGGEGNFWIDYRTTPPHNNRYRGISGWWPANLLFEASAMATGVNQGIDFSSGHIQYEVQIDLNASELNASPGDAIGCYIFSLDIGPFLYYGSWPTDVSPLAGGTWSGPFSYGTIILATSCTMGILGDVNNDGLANSTDALIILSYDAGLPIPQPILDRINLGFGNSNGDGSTNSTDALLIISFDVGIPVPFLIGDPVCL